MVDKAPLGTIKLLVKGNPSAVRIADKTLAFPLHNACEFSSVQVVKYLLEEHDGIPMLSQLDTNKDSVLHYACRGGNCEIVKYLLTNHASLVASATVNEAGVLPIHLLFESAGKSVVEDIDSKEHIETMWLMLLANPEAVFLG